MKQNSFRVVLAIFITFASIPAHPQTLSNVKSQLDQINGSVIVSYDLASKAKSKRYKVQLLCSLDSGRTFSDPLVGVSQDVGYNVKPGIAKQINWAYFVDMPDFTGRNVMFKVTAKEDIEYQENIILSLGGPEKFYQSIILPGYGNYHVRPGRRYMILSGVVYALLGAGTYLHFESRNSYDEYLSSSNPEMANRNFNRAHSLGAMSNTLLGAGFSIWAIDVGQVIVKGISNRKRQKEILKRRRG